VEGVAVEADVLDTLDSAEIAWIPEHLGLDRGSAEVPHRFQRSALHRLARADDRQFLAQGFRLGQDVAGQQHRDTAVARFGDAFPENVLHQRIQPAAWFVEQQQASTR
jgi:hypothetical protein